jgi:hypothetical protein
VDVQGGYAGDGLVGAEDQYSPDYLWVLEYQHTITEEKPLIPKSTVKL